MAIESVCNKNIISLSKDASVWEAAKKMADQNVGCIVIVEASGNAKKPVGLITDRDLAIKVLAENKTAGDTKVSEIMNTDLCLLSASSGINEAIQNLEQKGVRRAPVLDQEQNLCGVVSLDDLLVMLATEFDHLSALIQKQGGSVYQSSQQQH
jgi:CBS domain-containing protein